MRLVTIVSDAGSSLGLVSDGRVLDLPDLGRWPRTMRELAGAGPSALAAIASWADGTSGGRPSHRCAWGRRSRTRARSSRSA